MTNPPNHPKAIPPYLKQSTRSHSLDSVKSISSTRSNQSGRSTRSNRPHAQNEYIPTTVPNLMLIGSTDPTIETEIRPREWTPPPAYPHSPSQSHLEREEVDEALEEESDDEADWDAIRARDSENTHWRRPRPAWIYPYLLITTLTFGMSMAPKSELYINLACLLHPPREPSSISTIANDQFAIKDLPDHGLFSSPVVPMEAVENMDNWKRSVVGYTPPFQNATVPFDPAIGITAQTPGDKWFLKVQKDIYEYNKHRTSPSIPSDKPGDLPSGPIPQPEIPSPSTGTDGDDQDDGEEKTRGPPFHAIDPKMCKKDPNVQAAAAKLTMTLSVYLGILSALTTGFWGKMSDKIGRTKIFAWLEIALGLNELNFLLVASFPYLAPGGYNALLIGPTFEGLMGGVSCLIATCYAYVSDLTPDGSRAGAFSRLMGVIMSGFAVGPILGTLVIRATDNILYPFYISVVAHAILPFVLFFVIPESLSKEARDHLQKKANKKAAARKAKDALQREWEDTEHDPLLEPTHGDSGWSRISASGQSRGRKRFMGRLRRGGKWLIGFLEPLRVFKPIKKQNGKRDWNLTLVAVAVACESLNYGIFGVKAQYLLFTYGWTSAQLGPFMSATGFTRGLTLIVILPLIMRYLRNKSAAPVPPTEDVPGTSGPTPAPTIDPAMAKNQTRLDLSTVRASYLLLSVLYFIMASNLSEAGFIAASLIVTMGSGSSPALNSLALAFLPVKSETGRLFGALAVLHALGATLISPIVYGELFASTVGWYAPTVFVAAGIMPALALIFVMFIKIRDESGDEEQGKVDSGKNGKKRASIAGAPDAE